ncbi:hypothetical protein S83_057570 [Arachis hypogaea]
MSLLAQVQLPRFLRSSCSTRRSATVGEMGHYFTAMTKNRQRHSDIVQAVSTAEELGNFRISSCVSLRTWLNSSDSDSDKLDDFHRLVRDGDVRRLCQNVYFGRFDHKRKGSHTSLESSDGRVMEIDKSVAAAESVVLKGLLDSVGSNGGVIPLTNVSGDVLSEVILFLQKKRDFQEIVDKIAANYKGWSTAFINRNRPILRELHQAAEDLQIPSLLAMTTQELERHGGCHTNEYSFSQMFHYFTGVDNNRSREILEELDRAKLLGGSVVACKGFRDWFTQTGDFGKSRLEEFQALMMSTDFRNICLSLYCGDYRHQELNHVSLTSSDGKVLEMFVPVAVNQSLFLRKLVGYNGNSENINVSCTGHVLSQVIDFCQKTYDFLEIHDFHPIGEGLLIVDHFQGWMTEFLKRNRCILPHLDTVADFLNIPSLLVVTTEEVADLAARILDKTSIWCEKLSFSRMLSSLYVRVTE